MSDYAEHYARAANDEPQPSQSTHDALLSTIKAEPLDDTTKLVFADYLQDNGKAGAHLLRDYIAAKTRGMPAGRIESLAVPGRHPGGAVRSGQRLTVQPYSRAPTRVDDEKHPAWAPISLHVTHWKDETPTFSGGDHYLIYSVPVYSREHLAHLMSDFEVPEARAAIWQTVAPHLPSKGMPK